MVTKDMEYYAHKYGKKLLKILLNHFQTNGHYTFLKISIKEKHVLANSKRIGQALIIKHYPDV